MPEFQPSTQTDHEFVPHLDSLIPEENVHLSAEQSSTKSTPTMEFQADTTSFHHPSSPPKVVDLISLSFPYLVRLTNYNTCLNVLIFFPPINCYF